MATSFDSIYNIFLGKITDDMYLELSEEETMADLESLLIESLPLFEFPKFDISDIEGEYFNADLTNEEINIIATLMVYSWIKRQVASCENMRMKFGGAKNILPFHLVINVKILGENWNPVMGIRMEG